MECYATYFFMRHPDRKNDYILVMNKGKVEEMVLARYTDNEKNRAMNVANKEYIRFMVPRSESIRKYFAYTFEMSPNEPITSTDPLDDNKRTFGDAKKLGLDDLILIRFSEDMERMIMRFIKGHGTDKNSKLKAYRRWCDGEELTDVS